MTDGSLTWSGTGVGLVLGLGADSPVSLVSVRQRRTTARECPTSLHGR